MEQINTEALKKKILDLAIRGKLVEQDPNDEPASVLLEKIREEKEELIQQKKIKRNKNESYIFKGEDGSYYEKFADGTLKSIQDEIPFEIPKGWEWASLGQITSPNSLNDGDWILSKNMTLLEEIKIVQLGHIGYGEYKNKSYKYISEETFIELNCTEIEKDYILINRLLGDVMYTCKLPEIKGKKITSVDVCWIMPSESKYNSDYLLYLLMSPYFQEKVFKLATGTTRLRISKGNLIKIIIPFPPINYQNKMVEKIKELFNIIDSIKQNKESLELIKKKVNVKSLNLAMQGKLVPQDSKDEPASVLLEKIKEEKEKLILEGKIKRNKKESTILRRGESYYELLDGEEKDITDEIPYDLPTDWTWVRLENVSFNYNGKRVPLSLNQRNNLKKIYNYYGATGVIDKVENYIFDRPLLLIGEDGANLRTRTKPLAFIACGKYWVNNHAHVLDSIDINILQYLKYYINIVSINHLITGSAQPKLTQNNLNNLLVPIPPLSEQIRIVKKLETIQNV
ncbi:hypothetical protein GTN30_10855 [Macrococcoides canis]|uniref:Type I restriction modification DNA specificity domain-containing protein n=1 Tax=Macrococcoides canis TaxID=1855823 RepID=A0AAE6X262_9STAP|nr:restriction endonuclease subunit S [Macrococcus canis]QIH79141.1 hypothetical protein GTN30_10855 [Macrococcus canis]